MPLALDFGPDIRTPVPQEGYLNFQIGALLGDERTGFTNFRHPAFFQGPGGATHTPTEDTFGFDRSDFRVDVNNVWVTDANGVTAKPNMSRDYDVAKRSIRR